MSPELKKMHDDFDRELAAMTDAEAKSFWDGCCSDDSCLRQDALNEQFNTDSES